MTNDLLYEMTMAQRAALEHLRAFAYG